MVQNMNMNQFEQAPIKGALDLSMMGSGTLSGIVSENQATALKPGDRVGLDNAAGSKVPSFVAVAASAAAFGVVVFTSKKSSPTYAAGDVIEVVPVFGICPIMWCEASAAIACQTAVQWAAGQKVEAGTTKLMGYTLDAASAAGQLIRVILTMASI